MKKILHCILLICFPLSLFLLAFLTASFRYEVMRSFSMMPYMFFDCLANIAVGGALIYMATAKTFNEINKKRHILCALAGIAVFAAINIPVFLATVSASGVSGQAYIVLGGYIVILINAARRSG